MVRTAITEEKIDVETVLGEVASSSDGAVLLFLGVVRNHQEGRQVAGLVYDAYREMAEETLERIAGEAEERFATDRIVVLHRVGALDVGEVSTAIAVGTPHREEAYSASRYVIEEIKSRLPIWKQERYVDGGGGWLEGRVPEVEAPERLREGRDLPERQDPGIGKDPPGGEDGQGREKGGG
jgi:molybdopterin synthase catalytic subunit